ncbi:MarR family transcriptional regulator [Dermabacteraceae bacterium TAE3-ERU27]|nr:MarR family transcriptional regulator [Dermabacteraceae bacterium TAE3-ERU27]
MPAMRETDMLVTAATLYYVRGMSQSEVARELGVSRSNVSRILTSARERGIVEITIHDPDAPLSRERNLEQQLKKRFHLTEAIVVQPRDLARPLDTVSRAGADFVRSRAPRCRSIGVSWGQSVQEVVSQIEPVGRKLPLNVLPLVGGMGVLDTLESGDTVVSVLGDRLGARTERLYAPAVVKSAAAHAALLAENSISQVLDAASKVDLALVGIGSFGMHSSPHLLQGMDLSEDDLARFLAQRPVGDICGRFVNAQGEPVGPPTSRRVISVSFNALRRIPCVLGIAAGSEKAAGVTGVLRSGVINRLIVDADLARNVLARGKEQAQG